MFWPSATARSARRSIQTLLARLDLKLGDRVSDRQRDVSVAQRRRRRAGPAGRRPRLRPALPDQRTGAARHRIVAARQPGALDLPAETARQCGRRYRDFGTDRRGANRIAGGRLGNPLPQQCLAAARAHHQPLHPVPHAGRPCRVAGRRRRRRQRGQKPYRSPPRRDRRLQGARRHRPRRVCDLPDASDRACRDRLGDRPGDRRSAAFHHRRPVRQIVAAAGGAGAASGRIVAVVHLRPAHRARLWAMAARPRPRRAGGGVVSRDRDRRGTAPALALPRADGDRDRIVDRGRDRACL